MNKKESYNILDYIRVCCKWIFCVILRICSLPVFIFLCYALFKYVHMGELKYVKIPYYYSNLVVTKIDAAFTTGLWPFVGLLFSFGVIALIYIIFIFLIPLLILSIGVTLFIQSYLLRIDASNEFWYMIETARQIPHKNRLTGQERLDIKADKKYIRWKKRDTFLKKWKLREKNPFMDVEVESESAYHARIFKEEKQRKKREQKQARRIAKRVLYADRINANRKADPNVDIFEEYVRTGRTPDFPEQDVVEEQPTFHKEPEIQKDPLVEKMEQALAFYGFSNLNFKQDELMSQYKKIMIKYHPDNNTDDGALEMSQMNGEFFELLKRVKNW